MAFISNFAVVLLQLAGLTTATCSAFVPDSANFVFSNRNGVYVPGTNQTISPGVVCTNDTATHGATIDGQTYCYTAAGATCPIIAKGGNVIIDGFLNLTATGQIVQTNPATDLDPIFDLLPRLGDGSAIASHEICPVSGAVSTCLRPGRSGAWVFSPDWACYSGTLICDDDTVINGTTIANNTAVNVCGWAPYNSGLCETGELSFQDLPPDVAANITTNPALNVGPPNTTTSSTSTPTSNSAVSIDALSSLPGSFLAAVMAGFVVAL